jgi:hypothetical protein
LRYDAPVRTALALALALAVSASTAIAPAEEGRPVVVLVRPAGASALVEEMLGRTRAELAAAGFDARIVQGTPGAAPRAAIEGADARAIAAIAIVDPEGEATVEIWVDDRLSGKMSIRPLVAAETDQHKAASVLAIQAVELLRASLVEITRTPLPQPGDRPDPAPRPPAPPAAVAFAQRGLPTTPAGTDTAPPPRVELSLAAGPSAFLGFDPGAVQLAPTFALALTAPSGLGGRVRFTGPGWGPAIEVEGGEVSLTPWLLTAGGLFAPRSTGRWFGFVTVDGGAFHLDAEGVLEDAKGRSGSSLVAALLGGGGGGLRLTDNVALMLEAQLMVTAPRITVVVGGDPVATAGRPWAATTLALQLTR